MTASRPATMVVGIDVGGARKGFHAVALEEGRYRDRLASSDTAQLVTWCVRTMDAAVIAVDAPCRWRLNETGRLAERELMKKGIWCFSTPTSEVAHEPHPTGYYDWMLRGEAIFTELEKTHPLCTKPPVDGELCCFETFPHAITWHLRGGNADAKQKRTQRRQLLARHNISTEALTNIDWVDAALCALTAHMAAKGMKTKAFGEAQTGFIVVPAYP